MKITQNLAKELESKLSYRMKLVKEKKKQFMTSFNQKEANKKDAEAVTKKNGVKLAYEE
jgi:hypothetical protein